MRKCCETKGCQECVCLGEIVEELEGKKAEELLRFAFETYGEKAAIGTSLQKTGVVTIDLASRLGLDYRVFFIDTCLNHDETHQLLGEVEERYGITIEKLSPAAEDIEAMYNEFGQYPFYFPKGRERCCEVRKVRPTERIISTLDVWISGIRADQSKHRKENEKKVAIIKKNNRDILKINPLFNWTEYEIDRYIRENNVPYNRLYDFVSHYGERYRTIGCKPCHIPIKDALPQRAGKVPWSFDGKQECGVHIKNLHEHGSGI